MYLVDTNIVSMLDDRRHATAPELVRWLGRNGKSLFLSSITLAEMETGVVKLRRENKRPRADELADLIDQIETEFGDRVLPVDGVIARRLAHIGGRIFPNSIGWPDLIIAATAEVRELAVLTRNVRHFRPTGVPVIDPFEELPPDIS